jgi:hypothetical protein
MLASLLVLTQLTRGVDISKTETFNIFDRIPALAAPKRSQLHNELDAFLSSDPEFVEDVIAWWHEKRTTYPCLSCMALDYLTLPGIYINLFIRPP